MDEVFWTATAGQDLLDIGNHISLDSPRSAEAIVRRIGEAVAMLAYHPKLGRENTDRQTRRLVITGTPYIAIYRLRERIEIVTVFHGARRWPEQFGQ